MAARARKGTRGGGGSGESVDDELDSTFAQIEAQEAEESPNASSSAGPSASEAAEQADRRLMGAAATVGCAAGAVLLGPVGAVVLGGVAAAATTREDRAGTIARKVGSVYVNMADKAIDTGLEALDHGVKKAGEYAEEGAQRLQKVDLSAMPAPVRAAVDNIGAKSRVGPGMSEKTKELLERYKDRVPVVIDRSPYAKNLPDLPKKQQVLLASMHVGELKLIIHNQLSQLMTKSAEQTIYVFVQGKAPKTSMTLKELYDRSKSDDGLLYIKYAAENTLGAASPHSEG